MSPKHSIDYCPICGGGLCGIRLCGLPSSTENHDERPGDDTSQIDSPTTPHGLIVCDECEAIWLEPDTSTDHVYPSAENAACPICSAPLWGDQSRWASSVDIQSLGWTAAVNPSLDMSSDEGIV